MKTKNVKLPNSQKNESNFFSSSQAFKTKKKSTGIKIRKMRIYILTIKLLRLQVLAILSRCAFEYLTCNIIEILGSSTGLKSVKCNYSFHDKNSLIRAKHACELYRN